ncbi:MAG TPA: FliG C-terminal domain-containing protein [Bacteroidales bacterium]|nr:FliG C-terminal domain-containing protein [Bacteroidales bacterium]HQQ01883.1 FliG C-terminal domain-containing protein [Bacteroidales bacterium]
MNYSDRKLKTALKDTDSEFIAKIIANSAEEVTDKILRNLTKQRGEEVKELALEIKKVSKKALSEAVQEILLHVRE